MKKAIVLTIAVVISVLLLLTKTFYHFKLHSWNIMLSDVHSTDDNISFDIQLIQGFFVVTDYSYEIEGRELFITFYGSYPMFKPFYDSVDRISIDTEDQITCITGLYTDRKMIMWEQE